MPKCLVVCKQNISLIISDGSFFRFPQVKAVCGKQWLTTGLRHKLTSQSVVSFCHYTKTLRNKTCKCLWRRKAGAEMVKITSARVTVGNIWSVLSAASSRRPVLLCWSDIWRCGRRSPVTTAGRGQGIISLLTAQFICLLILFFLLIFGLKVCSLDTPWIFELCFKTMLRVLRKSTT